MSKLSVKQAQRIAHLYNSVIVAEGYMRRFINDKENHDLWLKSRDAAAQRLCDEFGIKVIGVNLIQRLTA